MSDQEGQGLFGEEEQPRPSLEEPRAPQSHGGRARAAKLTPEERSEIAKRAAAQRWSDSDTTAICGSPEQPLRIGDVEIECYVLEDGTRVLTQATCLQALGRHPKANVRREGEEQLPAILQGKAINPFISAEVRERADQSHSCCLRAVEPAATTPSCCPLCATSISRPVPPTRCPRTKSMWQSRRRSSSEAWRGSESSHSSTRQRAIRSTARQMLSRRSWRRTSRRSCSPGCIPSPTSSTGRCSDSRQLQFPKDSVSRPPYFGHLTNDVVYSRPLPPECLKNLRPRRRGPSGRHKEQLHRRLSTDLGHPKLREHLAAVVAVMKRATTGRTSS